MVASESSADDLSVLSLEPFAALGFAGAPAAAVASLSLAALPCVGFEGSSEKEKCFQFADRVGTQTELGAKRGTHHDFARFGFRRPVFLFCRVKEIKDNSARVCCGCVLSGAVGVIARKGGASG